MKQKKPSFKELIKESLSEDEQAKLKTAYDAIGDIAILEIDEELRVKEKLIAETLLKCQKNIKTVLRKDGAHEGKYRIQKYKWLAGVKTKETIHKENYCRLKLDVEEVYFSPRMSNERLRITNQIQPGERILIPFCGCAPYPCVLAKNTQAKQIIGIELNPVGHKYGIENIKLNKLNNVILINDDAKIGIQKLLDKKIGLKSYWDPSEMQPRLKENPPIMELFLKPEDLFENIEDVEKCITDLQTKNIKIFLHTPHKNNGVEVNICSDDKAMLKNSLRVYKKLEALCVKFNLSGYIMHPYTFDKSFRTYKKNGKIIEYDIDKKIFERSLKKLDSKYIYIENMTIDFFNDVDYIIQIIKKFKVKLCLDLVHLFLGSKSVSEFYESVQKLSGFDPYYHIADTKLNKQELGFSGIHAHKLGTGNINLERIIPLINKGIIEVCSTDERLGKEMIQSYSLFNKMVKDSNSFDRILMPLPMGGEDFLDIILKSARKGTIIHFYDFLHEDDFYKAKEKVDNACKNANLKYKVLEFVKCGQFSPRTFRICLDFQIL